VLSYQKSDLSARVVLNIDFTQYKFINHHFDATFYEVIDLDNCVLKRQGLNELGKGFVLIQIDTLKDSVHFRNGMLKLCR
jgi:hypothetical protein